tara:strand:- start:3100 stop:4029 length:930 start_codon:yes stop_codon:yes gene_type:complete
VNKDLISIVVPVFNSDDCVDKLCEIIDKEVNQEYELILINDKSSDNSWAKIKARASINEKIIGVNLRKNFGQDNAIMAGLSIAKGDYIVIMDDDLQHSPLDIEKLYKCCKDKADVCYLYYDYKKQKLWKNIGSWLNGKISQFLIKKPKKIYLSPFKIMTRDLAVEICKYPGPYPYIDGLIFSRTDKIKQIKGEHSERYRGKGNYGFKKSIKVFSNHSTGYSVLPLRIATFGGISISIISLLLAIYYIIEHYFLLDTHVEGWTTLVVLQLFLSGVILVSLGIVGEYLGRAYLFLNQKPQYIIEKVYKKNV